MACNGMSDKKMMEFELALDSRMLVDAVSGMCQATASEVAARMNRAFRDDAKALRDRIGELEAVIIEQQAEIERLGTENGPETTRANQSRDAHQQATIERPRRELADWETLAKLQRKLNEKIEADNDSLRDKLDRLMNEAALLRADKSAGFGTPWLFL